MSRSLVLHAGCSPPRWSRRWRSSSGCATRQVRHVALHRDAVPAAFARTIALAAHQKRRRLHARQGAASACWQMAFGAAVLLGWTLLGGLDALNAARARPRRCRAGALAYQLALLAAFVAHRRPARAAVRRCTGPFALEQRFGFNRMTLAALARRHASRASLLGARDRPAARGAVLWIMGAAGALWWLWAWAAWMAFNLLLLVVYPTLIAPLFNKFEPLDDEPLQARVAGADGALRLRRARACS